MANYVEYGARLDVPDLAMSNSVTSAFICVIAIACSRLADTPNQRRINVWLAERDQSVAGLGCVGFDIVDLPWRIETFSHDQEFLLAATAGARNQLGWGVLAEIPYSS